MLVKALTFQKFKTHSIKSKKNCFFDTDKDDTFLQEESAWDNHQKTVNIQVIKKICWRILQKSQLSLLRRLLHVTSAYFKILFLKIHDSNSYIAKKRKKKGT